MGECGILRRSAASGGSSQMSDHVVDGLGYTLFASDIRTASVGLGLASRLLSADLG